MFQITRLFCNLYQLTFLKGAWLLITHITWIFITCYRFAQYLSNRLLSVRLTAFESHHERVTDCFMYPACQFMQCFTQVRQLSSATRPSSFGIQLSIHWMITSCWPFWLKFDKICLWSWIKSFCLNWNTFVKFTQDTI
jgi:hypothetical protein